MRRRRQLAATATVMMERKFELTAAQSSSSTMMTIVTAHASSFWNLVPWEAAAAAAAAAAVVASPSSGRLRFPRRLSRQETGAKLGRSRFVDTTLPSVIDSSLSVKNGSAALYCIASHHMAGRLCMNYFD